MKATVTSPTSPSFAGRPKTVEIVPAILRRTFEGIRADWLKVQHLSQHIHIDITDGIFAGDGTFRDLVHFRQLPESEKIELHMMVHTPAHFVDRIIELNPARVIFHLESFSGTHDLEPVYKKLRRETQTQLALALNPESPNDRLEPYLHLLDYVLFMGYNPGWAGQELNPIVYKKIAAFHLQHHDIPIAVDGHVSLETMPHYYQAGATIFCANTALFGDGTPEQNYENLKKTIY